MMFFISKIDQERRTREVFNGLCRTGVYDIVLIRLCYTILDLERCFSTQDSDQTKTTRTTSTRHHDRRRSQVRTNHWFQLPITSTYHRFRETENLSSDK